MTRDGGGRCGGGQDAEATQPRDLGFCNFHWNLSGTASLGRATVKSGQPLTL